MYLVTSFDGDVLYSKVNVVFMPPNSTSILKPMGQGEISAFMSYYLRNTVCKVIVAIDSDSSNGVGQSKLKTFWKGFTFLDMIKNNCDSWNEVKISILTGVLRKLFPTFVDDIKGFKTSVGEVTADLV